MRIKLYLRGGDEQKTPPRIARVGDGTGVTSMEALAELVVQDKYLDAFNIRRETVDPGNITFYLDAAQIDRQRYISQPALCTD